MARESGLDVFSFKFPMMANGKAQALGQPVGFAKLIAMRDTGQLVAAHLIGPEVTELLPELTLACQAELTVEDIANNIHAHPTLSETLKDTAHGLLGHAINI